MQDEAPDLLARYKARLANLRARSLDKGLTPQESLEISALQDAIEYRSGDLSQASLYAVVTQKQDLFSEYLKKKAGRPQPAKDMCRSLAKEQNQWTFRDLWQGLNYSIRKKFLVVVSGEGGNKLVALPELESADSHRRSRKKIRR